MEEQSSSGATNADSVALLRTDVGSSDPCKFVLQVDVAVLEVGLGGKFDATNVICE